MLNIKYSVDDSVCRENGLSQNIQHGVCSRRNVCFFYVIIMLGNMIQLKKTYLAYIKFKIWRTIILFQGGSYSYSIKNVEK